MKRLVHILSISVVAAVMCLLLVAPASALAFGQLPSEIEVSLNNVRWSFSTLDGTTVRESTYADKTHLLIFINSAEEVQGGYTCVNSSNTVRGIAASDWIADDRVQVTVIDAMGNDRDSMAAMKEKLAPNDTEINFSWGGNAFLNSLLRKCPGLSNQFAFTFIIQGSTVRYAWNGPYSKDVYNGVLDSLIPGILGDDDSMNLYHFGITGACDYTKASEVLELLNDHREKNGLTPLTMDAELTEAAMQRAAEIAIYNSHTRPDMTNCYTAFPAKFQWSSKAENIAAGYDTARGVMIGWINSPGHNRNMLTDSYRSVGLGVFENNGIYYWVQLFSDLNCQPTTKTGGVSMLQKTIYAVGEYLDLYVDPTACDLKVGEQQTVCLYNCNAGYNAGIARIDPVQARAGSIVEVQRVLGGATVTARESGSTELLIGIGGAEHGVADKLISVPVTVQAKPVELTAPELTVSNCSSGQPVVSWSAVVGATGYELYRADSSSGPYYKYHSTGTEYGPLYLASAAPGSVHYFKVRAICNGAEGPFSETKISHCALPQPTITVKNRASDGKPTISWKAVEGATGYEVYYCGTSGGTYKFLWKTDDPAKLSVTHTGAVLNNDYFYKVVATHSNSKCNSAMSAAKGVWVDLKQPAITVVNRASDGKPVISWSKVAGAAGYTVYYCGTSGGTYSVLYSTPDPNKLSVTHTNAMVCEDYFYKVVATHINSKCNSAYSAVKGVWVDLKQPTITVKNRASDGKPYISWNKVTGATGYAVYYCGTSGGTYKFLWKTDDPNRLSVTHTNATVGEDYFYKVVATHSNSKCNSVMSAAKGVWVDLKAPTITVANRASDGKPVISWNKVTGATGYEVYFCDTSDGVYKFLWETDNPNKLSVTHTGAATENDYFYKVVALHSNSKFNSAYSAVKGVWCDLKQPTLSVSLNSKSKPYLTWSKVTGADKYQVYVSVNGGEYKWLYTAPANGFAVTHTGAKAGNTYSYKVIAVSTVTSKANSSYSAVKTISTP